MSRTIFATNLVTVRPWTMKDWMSVHESFIESPHSIWFTIYESTGWQPVGMTGLTEIDFRCRSAEFNIMIGPRQARGVGYGTEATRLLIDYGFTALGLANISPRVMAFNVAGIRAYTKAGFREFGRRHKCQAFGAELVDVVYMEALADEFEQSVLSGIFSRT